MKGISGDIDEKIEKSSNLSLSILSSIFYTNDVNELSASMSCLSMTCRICEFHFQLVDFRWIVPTGKLSFDELFGIGINI